MILLQILLLLSGQYAIDYEMSFIEGSVPVVFLYPAIFDTVL